MSRRRTKPWRLLLIGGLLLPGLLLAQTPTRPNILLIYVDDLGYGDLASFGHPVLQTPHLDALAASGLKLTNYYAPSALCSPSRAALLTGRHPYRTGIESWIPADSGIFLRAAEITLAEVLKSVGYQTALIGKWHLNSDLASTTEPQPNDQGFDFFYGHNAFQIPTNRNPTNLFRNREALPTQIGYTAELYSKAALDWLQTSADDAPFFLMLSMAEPHTTFENPPAYNALYANFTRGEIVPIPSGLAQPPRHTLIARGPGEYYANITYMDAHIGRVLDWLAAHPQQMANTVVVFASDNGPVTSDWINWWEVNAYGDTGGLRGRKHFLYEGGIKVPAIIRYPGITIPGSESAALITGTDLFTTLVSAAGATLPADRAIDGIDVSAALSGDSLPTRPLLWALPGELEYAYREGPWKLMLDSARVPRALFNLQQDPLELFNELTREPEQREHLQIGFETRLAAIRADALTPRGSGDQHRTD